MARPFQIKQCDVLHMYVRSRVDVPRLSGHISKVRLGGVNQVACLLAEREVVSDNEVDVGWHG